ncbi:MAG TPA: VOC family protein [Candidatus Eisenbacteria bacterium]|nr:VOC family protein [Candidatus Eisenbacteria bacterium]
MSYAVDSIDHVEVFVRSIPEAIRWYGDVLGLKETARWDPEPVMIGRGGTQLALFQARFGVVGSAEQPEPPPLRWHRVAWKTDRAGFEAAQAHLASLGISFRGPVDHDPTVSIYFQDPDGNPLEITCPSR